MLISEEEALSLLHRSKPVAIPTETVWGLAARFADNRAVEQVFTLKGRPPSNPLIIHVSSVDMVEELTVEFPEEARLLIDSFWPGGLTVVLPVVEDRVPSSVRAALPTAAFRMPDNSDTLSLIERAGPLVAPSANLSSRPSSTAPHHVEHDFGSSFPILRTSCSCEKGIESTILIWKEGVWYVGRPGAVNIADIEKVLGKAVHDLHSSTPLCPGQHFRHYSPKAQLYLHTDSWEPKEQFDGVLGFEDRTYEGAPTIITMGRSTCPVSVAKRFYGALRELDDRGCTSVFVDGRIPQTVEWRAILDRLRRACGEKTKS